MTSDHPNRKWWTLFAMCFALFMIMLDNTIVNVALPSIQSSLKTTPAMLEWTINAYVLTFAVLILFGGKLGDRFGRKRLFLAGVLLFSIASALCAMSSTAGQLVGFRALQGVGGALMNPLSLSIIVNAFPRKQIPTAIGVWAGISGLGLAVGPVLGGLLVEHVSWSAVFWVNVPIGVVAAAVTLFAVDESRDPNADRLDVVGTVLVTGGLFALVWGLIKTTTHPWLSAYTLGFLGLSLLLLVIWVVWESRVAQPMVPLEFFRTRLFSVSSLVVTLVGLAMFGSIFFITLYFQNVKGYSPQKAGVASLPLTTMILFVAPVAGRLNARLGARGLMTIGMLSASLGMLGLTQLSVGSSYNAIWPFYMLLGAGIAATMPAVSAAAMGSVDPTKSGIASGVVNASRQVGGALGIAVLGSIGAALTNDSWQSKIASLPPAAHGRAESLTQLVIGGRGREIGRIAGPDAQSAALHSFVHGVQGAMWAGAGLTFAAGLVAFFGLMRVQMRPAPAGVPVAVEA